MGSVFTYFLNSQQCSLGFVLMDKYEQMMQQMMQMSEAERMAMIEDLKKLCICSSCPSYNGTGEKGVSREPSDLNDQVSQEIAACDLL